jgi:hypothetical protein
MCVAVVQQRQNSQHQVGGASALVTSIRCILFCVSLRKVVRVLV